MKIVLITPVTPYKENMHGPSGHPYHLMIERPKDIDITVYTFNQNNLSDFQIREVEHELDITIRKLSPPRWITWIIKFRLTFFRVFLKYPIGYYIRLKSQVVDEIKSHNPQVIWIYTQEFSGILKQFSNFKRLHTVPDCYCLHWYRRLGIRNTLSNFKDFYSVVINFRKYYRLEKEYPKDNNILYHFVGQADVDFIKEINPNINARFVRHPLYRNSDTDFMKQGFHSPIRLLIAGRYDLYSREASDELIESLCNSFERLNEYYVITILGVGWEEKVSQLKKAGWDVNWIKFVDNYLSEVKKHDIQLNALSVGTGTKGKVLDAISNGLLEIGTEYAIENIAVENRKSCIQYKDAKEVIEVLKEIPLNIGKYEQMAREGSSVVLREHSRKKIAQELFFVYETYMKSFAKGNENLVSLPHIL